MQSISKEGDSMQTTVRLSSKNQIVLPREAREAMHIKGRDELLLVVKDDVTIIMPKPKKLSGCSLGHWQRNLSENLFQEGTSIMVAPRSVAGFLKSQPAASAITLSATGFICNDKVFGKVKQFESLVIDDYV
jgi:AbrB family looped-hinge helix DNA binding protein